MGKLEPFAIAIVFVIVGPWRGTIVDQGSDAWWHTSCSVTDIIRELPLTSSEHADLHWEEEIFFFSCLCIFLVFSSMKKWKSLDVSSPAASLLLISRPPISPQVPVEETLKLTTMKVKVISYSCKNPKNFWWMTLKDWSGWWNVIHSCPIPFYLVRHT